MSKLKATVGYTGTAQPSGSAFCPGPITDAEYDIEDILDHPTSHRDEQYRIKWRGHGVFESTWEPLANLTNCPEVLKVYRAHRELLETQGGSNVSM